MQKVYLLLRNNQQTGPYSLEELLQQNLKSFDLVWVEGRSAAWRYPGEVETLKNYVAPPPEAGLPFQPVATNVLDEAGARQTRKQEPNGTVKAPHIFVSLPRKSGTENENPIQRDKYHATEAKQDFPQRDYPTAAFTSSEIKQPASGEKLETKYSRPLNEVEEEYTSWIYRQKTNKRTRFSKKNLLQFSILLAAIAIGAVLFAKLSTGKEAASLPGNTLKSEEPVARQTVNDAPDNIIPAEAASDNQESPVYQSSGKSRAAVSIQKNKNPNHSANHIQAGVIEMPKASPSQVQVDEPQTQNENVSVNNQEIPATSPENNKSAPKEKKKKVRDVLKDLFSKKQKPADKPAGVTSPLPQEAPPSATNRQSVHRASNETAGNVENLEEQVDISSNAPDNWMMGVTGLKVTLRNRSNIVIQSAEVTVLYLDENNQELDRKNIYFHNLPAKGKLTLPAPNNKFADHVTFKLGTVTGGDDRFARD